MTRPRLTPVQREILIALADGAVITGRSCLDYAIGGRLITCRTMDALIVGGLIGCIWEHGTHPHPITERGLAALGRASAGQGDGDDDGRE